jgi:hypothetical protein
MMIVDIVVDVVRRGKFRLLSSRSPAVWYTAQLEWMMNKILTRLGIVFMLVIYGFGVGLCLWAVLVRMP